MTMNNGIITPDSSDAAATLFAAIPAELAPDLDAPIAPADESGQALAGFALLLLALVVVGMALGPQIIVAILGPHTGWF